LKSIVSESRNLLVLGENIPFPFLQEVDKRVPCILLKLYYIEECLKNVTDVKEVGFLLYIIRDEWDVSKHLEISMLDIIQTRSYFQSLLPSPPIYLPTHPGIIISIL
jgi:hypothetical protein